MKRSSKVFLVLALILSVALVLSGCSQQPANTPANPPATAASDVPACKIDIVSGTETKSLTEADLSKIASVKFKGTTSKKDGTQVENEYEGLPLTKVLEAAGVTDFSSLQVTASDDYAVEYTADAVKAEGSILAFKRDGEALSDSGPLMTVLTSQPSNKWCKKVVKITVK